MKLLLQCIFCISLLQSVYCMAHDKTDAKTQELTYRHCIPTKNLQLNNLPEKFSSYNDMTRDEGGFSSPIEKKIILRGLIKDKNCVPISNAHIKLWQVDSYGNKRYLEEFSTPKDEYKADNLIYSKFQGTGMATTTNDGEFFIITIKPSEHSKAKRSEKYINFKVEHNDFPEISNKIILLENGQFLNNKQDFIIAKNYYNTAGKNLRVYDFEIVLDGVSKHSRY